MPEIIHTLCKSCIYISGGDGLVTVMSNSHVYTYFICIIYIHTYTHTYIHMGFPDGSAVKNLLLSRRCGFHCWVGKIPQRREW